jgi:L-lactate dehydrogenase (cytochrome)
MSDIISSVPSGSVPFFFQLYVNKDRSKSEALLRQAEKLGCKAIVLTVDAPVAGKREDDERVKADETTSTPMSEQKAKNDKKGGGLGRLMGAFIDSTLNWSDLKWLKQHAKLPVVIKGIQTAMDAKMAMEAGAEGIVISNHGGRSLDGAPPVILVLLELQKNCPEVFNRMEVYIDGGIRRGTDILKALCLGATAVALGRPFLYAINYGPEGVEHLVNSKCCDGRL